MDTKFRSSYSLTIQYLITNGFLLIVVNGLYSGAKLRDIHTSHHHKQDHHPAQPLSLISNDQHYSCPPCNTHNCPMVTPETCNGRIVKDKCDCCPVCNTTSAVDVLPSSSSSAHLLPGGTDMESEFEDIEDPEACSQIQCPKQKICLLNIQGIPICRCPSSIYCREKPRKDVCSMEGKTYRSLCYLKMEACDTNRKISVKHKGPCEDDTVDREERKRQKEEKREKRLEKKRIKMEKKTARENKNRDRMSINKKEEKRTRKRNRNDGKVADNDRKPGLNKGKIVTGGTNMSKERREQLREERRRHRRKLRKIMKDDVGRKQN